MGLRPQTLYGIADSPVGLAAWMLDHDEKSYELIEQAFVGQAGGLSRDDVLDNVTHYWLTNTAISSSRLYWESHLGFFDVKGVDIPVGVTVFPDELYPAPRSWAEQAYPRLIHFNVVDQGGHFAPGTAGAACEGGAHCLPIAALSARAMDLDRQGREEIANDHDIRRALTSAPSRSTHPRRTSLIYGGA